MKVCIKCKKRLSDKEFYHNSKMRSGRINDCKTCISEYARKRYKDRKVPGINVNDIKTSNMIDLPLKGSFQTGNNIAIVRYGLQLSFICPNCGREESILKDILNYGR